MEVGGNRDGGRTNISRVVQKQWPLSFFSELQQLSRGHDERTGWAMGGCGSAYVSANGNAGLENVHVLKLQSDLPPTDHGVGLLREDSTTVRVPE